MGRWGTGTRGIAALLAAAVVTFLALFLAGQGLARASLWAGVLALPVGVVAAGAAVWPLLTRSPRMLVPTELEVPEWAVGRPAEAGQVVTALLASRGRTVAITTGLHGAGGFGKTTLAQMVCADRRIRKRFPGGVFSVTVGRDTRGAAAVAAKVNDVIKLLSGDEATFLDPEMAGRKLGALLDSGPRRLLVVDDVWQGEQLAPFISGGRRCARLVTTRMPGLLGKRIVAVLVDQMSADQARRLLMTGLPPLDPAVIGGLLAVTGRWPLLLRLVNKILVNAMQAADVNLASAKLLERLRADGPAVVDEVLGEDSSTLRVGLPAERAKAVRATIGASTSLLSPEAAQRFTELGIFAEDETIPFPLIALLWRATGGLDELTSSQLCARLAELALVSVRHGGSGAGEIVLHDVIRDFVRSELGSQQLAGLNRVMVDTVAASLPAAAVPEGTAARHIQPPWWELSTDERYLWDHLIEHLIEAGRRADAEDTVGDLRWVGARVREVGPVGPVADLTLVDTPRAARQRVALTRAAHLLAPTEPPGALVDVLHSRLSDDPDWGPQVKALRDLCPRPRLVNRWPLPDLPDAALRRVLTGHRGQVNAVAVAPDCTWLASSDASGIVRIWDTATGKIRASLTGHLGNEVKVVAIAPDGGWLATCGSDATARFWDATTGQEQMTLTDHRRQVNTVVIAPDGSWLATSDDSGVGVGGKVRIWDTNTGEIRAVLTGPRGHQIGAVAIAPDSSWLATGGTNGTALIWDAATWRIRATLSGHRGRVNILVIAPDGTWLATGDPGQVRIWDVVSGRERASFPSQRGDQISDAVAVPDRTWIATIGNDLVRIWDTATGQHRATLSSDPGHRPKAMAVAPDGTWIVTGGTDRTVRIWDAATGKERSVLTGHTHPVTVVAIAPDGSWFVTGDAGGTARIWNASISGTRPSVGDRRRIAPLISVSPDLSWLATVADGKVRIWDTATGRERHAAIKLSKTVKAKAIAPDGSWLATMDSGRLRIWDTATGRQRAELLSQRDSRETAGPALDDTGLAAERTRQTAMALAPDGTWLASGDSDGWVQIWDTASWQRRTVLPHVHLRVSDLRASADSNWLTVIDDSFAGNVRIWSIATRQPRAILHLGKQTIYDMAIGPDGSWLATLGGGKIRIWDSFTGGERASLHERNAVMLAMAVTPDGKSLFSGDSRGTVRVWHTATGQEHAVFPRCPGRVTGIRVAPDGNWLAIGDDSGAAGMVRIWDAATGHERAAFPGNLNREGAVSIAPDGSSLAIRNDSNVGVVRIWDTATGRPRAQMRVDSVISACAWVGPEGLALAGSAGLYLFDFLVGTSRSAGQKNVRGRA